MQRLAFFRTSRSLRPRSQATGPRQRGGMGEVTVPFTAGLPADIGDNVPTRPPATEFPPPAPGIAAPGTAGTAPGVLEGLGRLFPAGGMVCAVPGGMIRLRGVATTVPPTAVREETLWA